MTFAEFMEKMLQAYPNATVEPDDEMQLVVHTGLFLTNDDDGGEIVVDEDPNS